MLIQAANHSNNLLCLHCQNQISNSNAKLSQQFCCSGCEFAYEIIHKIGLKDYYRLRKIDSQTRKIKPEINEKISIAEFVEEREGLNSLLLAIDGLHCAACVWLIESVLKKQENVVIARVNLSKKYLRLSWRGAKEKGDELVNLIQDIGYKLFPFDEKILAEEEKNIVMNFLNALLLLVLALEMLCYFLLFCGFAI